MGKYKAWTPEERTRLVELVEETCYSYACIGRILGRHGDTVRMQYNKIVAGEIGPADPLLAALIREHGEDARKQKWPDIYIT